MKISKFFGLVLLIAASFSSCVIEDDVDFTTEFIGSWIWVESSGGIDGRTVTPESTGNTIVLKFTSNTFKRYVNGELKLETNYEIKYGESIRSTNEIEIIFYKNGINQSFELSDGNLILFDECYDCFQSNYMRE